MSGLEHEFEEILADHGLERDETICIRCSSEWKQEIQEIADDHSLTMSYVVRMAIIRLVREEAKACRGGE